MGFKRINYPDGQVSAKWEGGTDFGGTILERINSYQDLFYVRAIADIINSGAYSTSTSDSTLFIPCMFGQRSDRRFDKLQSFDLKLITNVINDCGFGRVQILDPHSDVTLALINNSQKVSSFEYVKKAIDHYHSFNAAYYNGSEDPILVSPDAGAYKKVFEYGQMLGLEVVAAVKHRDGLGKVDLKFIGDVKNKPCFIVDDLCDGGYTFLVLADALRKQGARKVYLYITHGIFSKGFVELQKIIDRIYCTNSVKDFDTFDWHLPNSKVEDYVTQFKVV